MTVPTLKQILTAASRSRGAAARNDKPGPVRWVVGKSPQTPRIVGVQCDRPPRLGMDAQPAEGERCWVWEGKDGWIVWPTTPKP